MKGGSVDQNKKLNLWNSLTASKIVTKNTRKDQIRFL